MQKIILESERLYLREWTDADIDLVFELDTDEDIMRYIRPPSKTQEDVMKAYEKIKNTSPDDKRFGNWICVEKETDRRIGSFVLRKNANGDGYEFGYRFSKSSWGKGYATEMSKAIIEYAFTVCKLDSLCALTHPENTASQNVLLKCGLKFEKNIIDDLGEAKVFVINNI
ncbi:MAG: GNAT family N-acetyltransferase [Fimbriimonadaceae bacterium]|nr:GNAT family N-acetyltransferase [Chitinophagales bacterium]